MSLPASGHYLITSNNDHRLINRKLAEDLSDNPKGIFQLPPDASSDVKENGWIVEKLEDGKYILRAKGSPTGVHGDRVVAFLMSEPAPEHWILETTDQANVYTIKTSDGKLGWTIEDPSVKESPIKVTNHPVKLDFTPVKD